MRRGPRGLRGRMPLMNVVDWKTLSQLLDQLLEMTPTQRQQRLCHLHALNTELAATLERLLANEHEAKAFLVEPCWSPPTVARTAGARVGPYRLLRALGEGGMGEVWLAERADGLYQRQVALKLLRSGHDDPGLQQRFSQEREILARLQHPHLAHLLDAGVGEEGQPYLALRYVDGEPISDYCQRRRLPLDARLRLMIQLCTAVSHAHANLVVHRDLKPSNILVTAEEQVCVLDFGIAQLLVAGPPAASAAAPEARAFTLHYAAPEQVRGEAITTLTDVYSLGVVLYEVLLEQKPYRLRRQNDAERENAILAVEPCKPSLAVQRAAAAGLRDHSQARHLARRLRGDLDSILLKALQKDPSRRYASAEALGLDLQRYLLGRPVRARPSNPWYRLRKYVGRHRWAVALGSPALAALLGTSVTAFWQAHQARIEMTRAQAMQNFVIGLFDVAGSSPHRDFDIRRLLEAGEQRGHRELAQQPVAQAELDGVIARLRIGLGDYREALALLEKQQVLLNSQPRIPAGLQLEAVTQHGRVLRLLGQSSECIGLMQPMLALVADQQKTLPLQAANFYSQLGRCERMAGSAEQARHWLRRSLMLRGGSGGDRIGVIENLTDLAAMEGDAGRSDIAISGYRQAMALLRQQTGERHPLMVNLRRSIAVSYRDLGDSARAEKELRTAIGNADQLNGDRHPETLAVRRLLGAVLIDRGQLAQAETELMSAHAMTLESLGPAHRETGLSWNSLGVLALERGQLAEAVHDIDRSVQVWRQPDSQRMLPYGLYNYGWVLMQAGRYGEALPALREARQLRVAQLGEADTSVADVDRLIADILAEQGHREDADVLLTRAILRARRHYGENHPRLQAMRLSQARNWGRLGHQDQALQQLQQLATTPGEGIEQRKLRWLARGYAAELRCGQSSEASRQTLKAVHTEVAQAMPEGGSLAREIQTLQTRCNSGMRLASR